MGPREESLPKVKLRCELPNSHRGVLTRRRVLSMARQTELSTATDHWLLACELKCLSCMARERRIAGHAPLRREIGALLDRHWHSVNVSV